MEKQKINRREKLLYNEYTGKGGIEKEKEKTFDIDYENEMEKIKENLKKKFATERIAKVWGQRGHPLA